ncbi:MAG: GlsB/YeaQ/YmgE family stress response membrane protein [Planctomycetes bacterium]|nr:GlsB/YeaQ/YmgE family stress response membrane protein [Planctomycetota bacterium]
MDFELISQWMHLGLEWIGFGTLVGLIAKAVMPGKDGGGALATVILGILGSLIGAALLAFFVEGVHVTPISILGFFVALGGTSILLISYRILGGGAGIWPWLPFRRHNNRRRATTIVEDATV